MGYKRTRLGISELLPEGYLLRTGGSCKKEGWLLQCQRQRRRSPEWFNLCELKFEHLIKMIGTPFTINDEILQRRITGLDKKVFQQEARDDQGRKHFYGAFTGALKESSVGYKGTVGSREGWAPKEFVSSRSAGGGAKPT